MQINYSDLAANYQKLVDVLQAKIQRGDMSFSMPIAGNVADTENYPDLFETTDIKVSPWDDANVE